MGEIRNKGKILKTKETLKTEKNVSGKMVRIEAILKVHKNESLRLRGTEFSFV